MQMHCTLKLCRSCFYSLLNGFLCTSGSAESNADDAIGDPDDMSEMSTNTSGNLSSTPVQQFLLENDGKYYSSAYTSKKYKKSQTVDPLEKLKLDLLQKKNQLLTVMSSVGIV